MDMRLGFTFSPDGSGTRLQGHADTRAKGVMRLLAPLMMPMVNETSPNGQPSSRPVSPPRGQTCRLAATE